MLAGVHAAVDGSSWPDQTIIDEGEVSFLIILSYVFIIPFSFLIKIYNSFLSLLSTIINTQERD